MTRNNLQNVSEFFNNLNIGEQPNGNLNDGGVDGNNPFFAHLSNNQQPGPSNNNGGPRVQGNPWSNQTPLEEQMSVLLRMWSNRKEAHTYFGEFLGQHIPSYNVCSNEILCQLAFGQKQSVPLSSIPSIKVPFCPEKTDVKSLRERCIRKADIYSPYIFQVYKRINGGGRMLIDAELNKSFYTGLILAKEGDIFVDEVRTAYQEYLLNKSYGWSGVRNLQINPAVLQASNIQSLRTTGSGRGSRAVVSQMTRTQLINTDPTYKMIYESGLNISVRQYLQTRNSHNGDMGAVRNTIQNVMNSFNQSRARPQQQPRNVPNVPNVQQDSANLINFSSMINDERSRAIMDLSSKCVLIGVDIGSLNFNNLSSEQILRILYFVRTKLELIEARIYDYSPSVEAKNYLSYIIRIIIQ